ncbi:unnamed protein product [Alopecurus aequalis]
MAERLSRAVERTHRGLAAFSGVSAPVKAYGYGGDYITSYAIGDPPQGVVAIVDSMSDLIWTQSSTCSPKCSPEQLHYYNTSRSRTDHPVPCDHSMCAAGYETQPCMGGSGGNDDTGTCPVRATSYGEVAGVLGLGRGALSLVSQVGARRFSYCLTRFTDDVDSSPLFVGSSAGLSGDAPVTTMSFVVNPPDEPFSTFYYLPLGLMGFEGREAVLPLPMDAFGIVRRKGVEWAGGVVIGTNSAVTYLIDVAYRALTHELSWLLGSSLVQSPVDGLEICVAREDVSGIVPTLVLHFGAMYGGPELVVPPENYWGPVDSETSCMLVMNSGTIGTLPWNETTVIGTLMQQNRHFLFDLENEMLSFQTADCTSI